MPQQAALAAQGSRDTEGFQLPLEYSNLFAFSPKFLGPPDLYLKLLDIYDFGVRGRGFYTSRHCYIPL
jgi:hypothetical protein